MIIFVATISHRHGFNVYAATTHDSALGLVADYCREWWPDIDAKGSPPADDNEAVNRYFDNTANEEYFDITETELHGLPEPVATA